MIKRVMLAFVSVWLGAVVIALPRTSPDSRLITATGPATTDPTSAASIPSELLRSDLDLTTAALYESPDGLIALKVPSGWTLPSPKTIDGTVQPDYFLYDFTLRRLADRAVVFPEPTLFLASMRIQLGRPELIMTYLASGKAPTLHNALEGFAVAFTGYGNFGVVTDTYIGTPPLAASCLAVSRDATGGSPDSDGQFCAATVSEKLVVLVTYGSQRRLAPFITPVILNMLATLSITRDTLPTPTPVPPTPSWTPQP